MNDLDFVKITFRVFRKNRNELKAYCAMKNIKIRSFIEAAIIEKIRRDG